MKDDLANEDLAHLRALTEPKDDMLKRETPLPKASPVCPVCGIAVPHAHDYAGLMTLIVKQKNDLAAAQAERDALFRSKSTLNTRVLAAEAEVQALRVAHKAAIAEAVAKERVRVMLAIADEFCGYDDMAETLRERARGAA